MFFAGGFMRYAEGRMEHDLKGKPEGTKQDESCTTPVQGQTAVKLKWPRNRRSASRHQPEILLRAQLRAQ